MTGTSAPSTGLRPEGGGAGAAVAALLFALVGFALALLTVLTGPVGSSAAADQVSPWTRSMAGLYGDRSAGLVFVGNLGTGTRAMVSLARGKGVFRLQAGSDWTSVQVHALGRRHLVHALAPDLSDNEDRIMYAGLGRPLPLLARSDDYGLTWAPKDGPVGPRRFDALAVSRDGFVLAAEIGSQRTVWASDDEGATWVPHTAAPEGSPIKSLLVAPDDSTVYLVAGQTLYRSLGDPDIWEAVLGPRTTPSATVHEIAAGRKGRVHAAIRKGATGAVWTSPDRGDSWITGGWPEGADVTPRVMALGERDLAPVLWLGLTSGRVYESTDDGATWTSLARFAVPVVLIAQDPDNGEVWFGTDGLGLYRTGDRLLHTGAVPVNVLDVAAPAGSADMARAIAQVLPEGLDPFTGHYPPLRAVYAANGAEWTRLAMTSGLGTNLLASPRFASDRRLYSGRLISDDGGTIWRELPAAPSGEVPHVVAVGPITGTRPVVYGLREEATADRGGSGLTWSESGGARWQEAEGPSSRIAAVVVSPDYATDRTAYLATDHGFIYESKNGRSFIQIGRIDTLSPDRSLYDLAISPDFKRDQMLVAVVDDPAEPLQRAHVYISTKAGRGIWQDRSSGLPGGSGPRILQLSPRFSEDGVAFLGALSDGGLPIAYAATGDLWFGDLSIGEGAVLGFGWAGAVDDGLLYAAAGEAGLWVRTLAGPPAPPATATVTRVGGTPTASGTPQATASPSQEATSHTATTTAVVETETPTSAPTHPSDTPTPSSPPPSATATSSPAPPPRPIHLPYLERRR